jgi:1-phosphofructokinase family hexose kinase
VSIVGGAEGEYIKVNEPGPAVSAEEVARLLIHIRDLTRPGDAWVMSGSLTRGVSVDFYATAIRLVKEQGGRLLLDTSGEALRAGCSQAPDLVKPNAEEAAEMTGLSVATPGEAVAAARRIAALGPAKVVISLGSQGAVAVDGQQSWLAHPLRVMAANPVGAGDALVAGLASAWVRGGSMPELLRLGSACGASAAAAAGTGIGSREEIETFRQAVRVEEL